jgi:hypothetical protein
MAGAVKTTTAPLVIQDAALKRLNATFGMMVARWNDAPERTKDEVIAKLKEIAYAQRS